MDVTTPDCDTALLKCAFCETQCLLREHVLLAGHDRSDGGLLTTVLVRRLLDGRDYRQSVMVMGLVVEVLAAYEAVQVPAKVIAKTQAANRVKVTVNGTVVLVKELQDLWEATSFELDKLQSNPTCAEQNVKKYHKPAWKLTYEQLATPTEWLLSG